MLATLALVRLGEVEKFILLECYQNLLIAQSGSLHFIFGPDDNFKVPCN